MGATKNIKPFFLPPSLLLRQLGSVLLMGYLNKWRRFPHWLVKYGFKAIPVANGAYGMGCIGYPGHPVWEVTSACNLKCIHCHATGDKASPQELSTTEGMKLIEQIADVSEFRTLVFSGGEPLVRKDIFQLLRHSQSVGFANIVATNGTLIDEEMAVNLRKHGVVCNAISIDAADSETHNFIRQMPQAFELAIKAMEASKKAGIMLQLNTTAMGYNKENLAQLIDFVNQIDAGIMLMYQLVAVGRGEKIEEATLKTNDNEALCLLIAQKQKSSTTIIEPVAGPQYWAYLLEERCKQDGSLFKIAQSVFHGCAAGRGFAYIKANGDVWPCPFVEISAGNVREKSFKEIYEQSPVFQALRNREQTLKGRCGECRYSGICGGCRGRALAYSGDYLAEDPRCFLKAEGRS